MLHQTRIRLRNPKNPKEDQFSGELLVLSGPNLERHVVVDKEVKEVQIVCNYKDDLYHEFLCKLSEIDDITATIKNRFFPDK